MRWGYGLLVLMLVLGFASVATAQDSETAAATSNVPDNDWMFLIRAGGGNIGTAGGFDFDSAPSGFDDEATFTSSQDGIMSESLGGLDAIWLPFDHGLFFSASAIRSYSSTNIEYEDDAGEHGVELFKADPAAAAGGIVQPDGLAADALDDEEVAEIDEGDGRHLKLAQVLRFRLQALGIQPEAPRRLQDGRGFRTVARYAAQFAQGLQRDEPAVIAEHHAERGGSAFGRLQLEERRRSGALATIARRPHAPRPRRPLSPRKRRVSHRGRRSSR